MMIIIAIVFGLVPRIMGYLEAINPTQIASAETCFESKSTSPNLNCASETLSVLNNLKSALSEIQSVPKIVTRKQVPGIKLGLLNLFASNQKPAIGNFIENARMDSSTPWCTDTSSISELFFLIGSSLPVIFNSLEVRTGFSSSASISSFTLKHTLDGIYWSMYNGGQSFTVNSTFSKFTFVPFTARAFRLYIINPAPNTCAQFEALITPLTNFKFLSEGALIGALNCGFKLRASSIFNDLNSLKNANIEYGIHGSGAWCPREAKVNEWISVSSAIKMRWQKIRLKMQDGFHSYIKSFKIYYSDDGYTWTSYQNGVTIQGLTSTVYDRMIDLIPFDALVIRIYVRDWEYNICTRLDVFCSEI